MLKALIRTRLQALLNMWFSRARRDKPKRSPAFKILIGILAVYILCCFFFLFGGMFQSLCGPLRDAGISWLYFSYMGITAFALCFIGSVFTAQKQLFDAADNDLLLSMPIPASYILCSRMVMLLLLSYVFELLVAAPAGVVWVMTNGATVRGVIVFIVCCLALPFLVLTFSALFGWLLSIITARVRKKSLVTTLLSLAFMGAYFFVFSNMNNYLATLIMNSASIGESIKSGFYPAYAIGAAIADGSLSGLLWWLACCILPFAAVYVVLSRSFIAVTTTKRGSAKIKYTERAVKAGSASAALTKKELMRFSANGMVLMNTAIGGVFTLAAAVMMIFFKDDIMQVLVQIPDYENYMGAIVAAALSFLSASNTMSASSVSLEGKNVWITKALPVSSYEILRAKVRMHDLMTWPPVLVAAVIAMFLFRLSALDAVAAVLLSYFMSDFCARLGVIINLHFPRLDYTNEVAVVKQGVSLLITMLVSWGVVAIPIVAYLLLLVKLMSATAFVFLFALLLAGACLIMDRYLRKGGSRLFEEL